MLKIGRFCSAVLWRPLVEAKVGMRENIKSTEKKRQKKRNNAAKMKVEVEKGKRNGRKSQRGKKGARRETWISWNMEWIPIIVGAKNGRAMQTQMLGCA